MDGTRFNDNAQARRFELSIDGKVVGFAQYTLSGKTMTITHTEVSDEYEGKGYGAELARQSLDRIRANGLKVIPACRFIASHIEKNQEYADLVQPGS